MIRVNPKSESSNSRLKTNRGGSHFSFPQSFPLCCSVRYAYAEESKMFGNLGVRLRRGIA